jgi:flavin reductase (DIM6/NTAB) family NADH-FMN oxidoreductase RutF
MAYAETMSVATGAGRDYAPAEAFRDALRELAAGVALVTTGAGAERAGCAATSLTSLSLDPPTLLVCLNRDASTLRQIRATGVFAVNILGARHEALARRFSSAEFRGADRFAAGDWLRLSTGAPALTDALAVVDCRLERIVEHATHAIVIGAAAGLMKAGDGPALLHWRSRFASLG